MPSRRRPRQREKLSTLWERQRQAGAQKAFTWSNVKWSRDLDFWARARQLPADVRGVVMKAAAGLGNLQNQFFGAVIKSGAQIARASGISESAWWGYALPALVEVGFLVVVERGGGIMRGTPRTGRSNVYCVAGLGVIASASGHTTTVEHVPSRPERRRALAAAMAAAGMAPPPSPAPAPRSASAGADGPVEVTDGSGPEPRATGPP